MPGAQAAALPTEPASTERWELILPHRERLLSVAARRLPSRYDAEDCVHEALLRCALFDGLDERRAGAFLTSTVLRLCVDHHRRAARSERAFRRLSTPAADPGHEEQVCESAAGNWLLHLAQFLSSRERMVLLARADGLSTAEAAQHYGITLKSAESAFTRARARLLHYYQETA